MAGLGGKREGQRGQGCLKETLESDIFLSPCQAYETMDTTIPVKVYLDEKGTTTSKFSLQNRSARSAKSVFWIRVWGNMSNWFNLQLSRNCQGNIIWPKHQAHRSSSIGLLAASSHNVDGYADPSINGIAQCIRLAEM